MYVISKPRWIDISLKSVNEKPILGFFSLMVFEQ